MPPAVTRDRAVAWSCAAIAALVTLWLYTHYTHSLLIDARFLLALAITTLMPGFALTRRFDAYPWPVRLGVAFVLGLGPLLLGWAAAVLTGLHALVYVVTILLSLGFVARQRDPRTWRIPAWHELRVPPSRDPLPWWASLSLLAAWLLMLRSLAEGVWGRTPPSASGWYVDLYWHLSLTAESMHHVPPADPQSIVDGSLSYHWFANAFGAAIAMASGLTSGHDLYSVAVIGWYLPVAAATIGVVYGLGLVLSRSHAAASGAAILLLLGPVALTVHSLDPMTGSALVWLSPSHIFSLPVVTFAVWVLVDFLRTAAPTRSQWLGVVYVLALSPGAKVSVIPTLFGGVALVALIGRVLRRPLRPTLALLALMVAFVVLTAPFFAGGGGGSHLSYGATAGQLAVWSHDASHGFRNPMTITLVMWLMGSAFLPSLLPLAAWGKRSLRDPAIVLYFGAMAVALVAMFFLQHPSLSQIYFMRGLTPVTAAYVAWGATVALRRHPRTVRAGAVVLVLAALWTDSTQFWNAHVPRIWWLLPFALIAGWLLLRLVHTLMHGSRVAVAAGAAAVLGWACAPGVIDVLSDPFPSLNTHGASPSSVALTPGEVRMARELARRGSGSDLVATNVHCLPTQGHPHCDARGFWPSALTEKPVLVGAWAYSSSARTRQGDGGYNYLRQPYIDARIWYENEIVFTHPSRDAVEQLKRRGVKFLYADARAGAVSADLPKYATRIDSDGPVGIYRLP